MNSFTLINKKLHNEHIMAGLFAVLILYHLPLFASDKSSILDLLILTSVGLVIDGVASRLRYKRIWCCVSGGVTAAIISLLTYGVPMWGRILGVAIALIIGKHVWGGTGKNLFNPAMIGLLPIFIFFQPSFPFFEASILLLPAVGLSLVFLFIRPFSGMGFLLGALTVLLISGELSFERMMTYGIVFWACIIMTDPVTVTMHPVAGFAASLLAAICIFFYFPFPISYIISVLAVNIFSKVVEQVGYARVKPKPRIRLKKIYINDPDIEEVIDLTKDEPISKSITNDHVFDKDTILNRVRNNVVFGMGGGGFTTYKKIMAVMDAEVNDKYLIINGAECDPGLIHDKWLMKHKYDEIYKGVELLNSCIPFVGVYFAVKKSTLIRGDKLKLRKLTDKYPVGAERILVQNVLSKSLSQGEIPASEGILVLNVQTVYAITQAVLYEKPSNTRYLTVADLKNKTARVVKVQIGMKLREIMDAVYPGAVNIYAGGGMMQAHQAEDNDFVDKTVNFIATGPYPEFKESPQCSSCGMCTFACPCGLNVRNIVDLVDKGKLKEAAIYNVKECLSCGSCSYTCLAGRNLAAKVRRAKDA